MRYEDASGAFQATGPVANDDADTLAAGSRGPATGNLITGEGTQYGEAGADSAAGAHIAAIAGQGGEDSSFAAGKLSVAGAFGQLSVDAEGNYSYMANKDAPENVRDRFTYTLADGEGNTDTAALIVEIGKTPAVIKADAQQIVPGPDGVITLPPGVELSDIMVVGRNLVVNMPDGTQLIIVDGAIFVPQLVLGGVEVPATNVAALLIGQEPQPAAGETPGSSGGNFALPPPPLDPGVPLGDLLPPTEYDYTPPEPQEVLDILDREPEIFVQPVNQTPSIAAVDSVDEAGLPTRNGGEPEGSGEGADGNPSNDSDPGEATSGTIIVNSPDGVATVSINGVLVTGVVGQQIEGEYGTLTITGFSGQNILYSYTLNDNTSGDNTQDDFLLVVTDSDGDQASATLTIDIIDDVPTARNDTDAVVKGDTSTDGNVMTGSGTTSGAAGADTVGADNAELTGVQAGTSGAFTAVGDAGVTVDGEFGELTIFPDGSYTYTLHADVGDGGTDIFTYQLTDGDGDTETATLTIIAPPDLRPSIDAPNVGEAGTIVDEAGLPARGPESPGTGEAGDGNAGNESDDSEITTGTINFDPGDAPATITINGIAVTGIGQTFAGDYGTLTITGFNPNGSITYSYVLEDNVDHDTDLTPFEEFDVEITDDDGDTASDTLRIDIVDDAPIANNDTDSVTEDGPLVAAGNVISGAGSDGNPAGGDLEGADDAIVTLVDGLNPGVGDAVATPGGVAIIGQYGTLVIASDGSYTYTLDNTNPDVQALSDGDTLTEQFEYTLLDGDGDEDAALLTITINGDDDVPTVDVPGRREDGTVVDEAGLPPRGSEPEGTGEGADGLPNNESDDSEITSGVITYTPGDGATTITIGGVTITGPFPQTIAGDYGTLTITAHDPVAYTINYTYTLNDNVDHDSDPTPFESFEVVVSDSDGNPADDATGNLIIDIINDEPIARDDTDSVVEGESVNGNVLTGVGGDGNPAGADTPGADDFAPDTVVGVVTGSNDAVDTDNPATVGVAIAGTYGTLTLNADGSYTYTATAVDPPENAQDVFTYTIIDNDGNMDSATLTINVIDDLTPTVDVPTQGEDGTVVDEAGLPPRTGEPEGTGEGADGLPNNESDQSEITSGVINFTPGDTPATVSINGIVVTGIGQTFAGDYGTLEITGFDPNGSISYTYTLNDNVDHDSDATPFETFTISVEDDDGDVASDDLIIDIINDAPIARDDTDSVIEGATTDGNVLTGAGTTSGVAGADTPGADDFAPSAVVGVVVGDNDAVDTNSPVTVGSQITGTYGTLTLNADGSYSYEADPNTNPPPGAVDEFVYTVIDNDGNMDSAVLTISVIDDLVPDVPENTTVTLDDDALSGGNPGGTGDDPDSVNTSGSVAAVSGDGTITYALSDAGEPAGFDYVLQGNGDLWVMQGATHVLTITLDQSGNYEVTQVNPIDHPAGANENNVNFTVTFRATDEDGDWDEGTLSISVDDDTPVANDDTDTIASGGSNAAGNVLTGVGTNEGPGNADSVGADGGGAVVGVAAGDTNANLNNPGTVGAVIQGAYGDLTLNADGSYTYVRDDGTPGDVEDVFTYTFIDGDGDMVNATLTIEIEDASPLANTPSPVLVDDDDVASENGNPGGTGDDAPANAAGFLTGSGGDGDLDFYFDVAATSAGLPAGFTVDPASTASNIMILQGATLVLTIALNNETGAYTVTQNNSINHAAGANENNLAALINVAFYAEDEDGDESPRANLAIDVDDDTPVLGTIEDGTASNNAADPTSSGELNFSVGADSPATVVSITADNTGITSGGFNLVTDSNPAGNILTAYQDENGNGEYDEGETAVYTLTVDPNAGADGEWVFDLLVPLDPVITPIPIGSGSSFGVGPSSSVIVTDDATMQDLVFVTGWAGTGGFTDGEQTAWQGGGEPVLTQTTNVNGSTSGWGLANNNFDVGEFMRFDFGPLNDYDDMEAPDGPYEPPAETMVDVAFATFTFFNFAVGDTIKFVAHYSDGSFEAITLTNGETDSLTITAPAGLTIDWVDVYQAAGSIKLNLVEVGVRTSDIDETIDFNVTLSDSDGDHVSGGFSVNVADGNTPSQAMLLSSASQQQVEKIAANSNTLTMAAAVAAAGMVEGAAARDGGSALKHGSDHSTDHVYKVQPVDHLAADDGGAAVSKLSTEPSTDGSAEAAPASDGLGSDASSTSGSLDDGAAKAAPEVASPGSQDPGPVTDAAAQAAPAQTVAMVSAEALQAAGIGEAKQGGTVEKVVAEALGESDAPTVDGLLAGLPNGIGSVEALGDLASHDVSSVPAWHMGGHGPVGAGFDMLFKVDVAMHHQDAIQPAVNG